MQLKRGRIYFGSWFESIAGQAAPGEGGTAGALPVSHLGATGSQEWGSATSRETVPPTGTK